jgi:hypothetical protein
MRGAHARDDRIIVNGRAIVLIRVNETAEDAQTLRREG